jgi:hypothetical protein
MAAVVDVHGRVAAAAEHAVGAGEDAVDADERTLERPAVGEVAGDDLGTERGEVPRRVPDAGSAHVPGTPFSRSRRTAGRPSAPVAPTTSVFTGGSASLAPARPTASRRPLPPGCSGGTGGRGEFGEVGEGMASARSAPDSACPSWQRPRTRYSRLLFLAASDMHFRGIGTATPPNRYSKAQCLEAFERSDWFARLDARSHTIARLVLQRDNGIESRHLALDALDEVFSIDPDTLDRRFLAHAPASRPRRARRLSRRPR